MTTKEKQQVMAEELNSPPEPNAKIIQFPESRIVREVPSEAVKAMLDKGARKQIDEVVDGVQGSFFQELMEYGIDTETENFYKDFSYLCHVAKALVYRNFKLEHELHPFLDETVEVLSEDEFETMRNEAEENLGIQHDDDEEG